MGPATVPLLARPQASRLMRFLFPNPLDTEFQVNEPPQPTFLGHNADLMSLMSEVMVENSRLENLNTELNRRGNQPAELEKLLRALLPTLDSFDRVTALGRSFAKSEEVDNWLKSVESVQYRLLNLLESYGLVAINSVGQPVNLNIHEVVEVRPSEDQPSDTVISERQKGYTFRGKMLRDAKVVVAA